MIVLAMAGQAGAQEDERLWFDRAIAAQFDYGPAYHAILNAYLPRWGGSHEQMIAFGRACRATKRYDTEVPTYFATAVRDVMNEIDSPREWLRGQADILRDLMADDEARIAATTRKSAIDQWRSMLVIHAWLAEQYDVASRNLAQLPDGLQHIGNFVRSLNTSGPEVTSRALVHGTPAEKSYVEGESAFKAYDLARASAAYSAAAKSAPAGAQPWIAGRLDAIAFERAYAGGDWVKLTPKKGIAWRDMEGLWKFESDGTLINTGNGANALCAFRGRVGADFEIRGEFSIESPGSRSMNFGVVVGIRDSDQQNWYQCSTWGGKAGVVDGTLFRLNYGTNAPTVKVTLQPSNHFLVRVKGGRLTYQINDQTILEDYEVEGGHLQEKDNQFGFASTRSGGDNITRIQNLETRRLAK